MCGPTGVARIPSSIRAALNLRPEDDDAAVLKVWDTCAFIVCKPCWHLHFCPYGPLAEESPCLPHAERATHVRRLEVCPQAEERGENDGKMLHEDSRCLGAESNADPVPEVFARWQCTLLGHLCPTFAFARHFTDAYVSTLDNPRDISPETKWRVVARDKHRCQHHGVRLQDPDVEFDHVVPVAEGGSNAEDNVRVTCHWCNADTEDQGSS